METCRGTGPRLPAYLQHLLLLGHLLDLLALRGDHGEGGRDGVVHKGDAVRRLAQVQRAWAVVQVSIRRSERRSERREGKGGPMACAQHGLSLVHTHRGPTCNGGACSTSLISTVGRCARA